MKFSVGLFLVNLITISPCFSIDAYSTESLDPRIIQNTEFEGITERIAGGQEASYGQFPYQAGLSVQMGFGSIWCGGSLIDRRWVVTAAHCLASASSARVYLGAHNIYGGNEPGRQIIYVSGGNLIVHRGYGGSNQLSNDIALIRLPEDARIGRGIQIIALPSSSDANVRFEGVTAVASGWGRSSDMTQAISPVLRYVQLQVIPNNVCRTSFYIVRPSNICTNGRGWQSTCKGDSGGPLVYRGNGKNILIGLTSFGSRAGCQKGWPAVFTRITSYRDWIRSITGI